MYLVITLSLVVGFLLFLTCFRAPLRAPTVDNAAKKNYLGSFVLDSNHFYLYIHYRTDTVPTVLLKVSVGTNINGQPKNTGICRT